MKRRENIDACIYLGNDFNDISMFVEAIKDDDFIVIVGEQNKTTNAIKEYLQVECREREKDWEDVKQLDLDEEAANRFLLKFHRILKNIEIENSAKTKAVNYKQRHKESNMRSKQQIKNARNVPIQRNERNR